jgi:hypothetical protein
MRLIIHFGGKKVVKGTRENGYLCSFISKKSKNYCGSFLVQKKFKFVWGPSLWLNTMNFDLLHLTLLGKKKRKNPYGTIRLINYPFWERKEFKRNKRNGFFCSFLFKKSKNSCGVTFGPKILNFLWGPFWLNITMNFDLLHLTLLGKKSKEINHMAQ